MHFVALLIFPAVVLAAAQSNVRAKRQSRGWLVAKMMLLPVCLYCGLKFLEGFLIYSIQASDLVNLPAYKGLYETGMRGQMLTLPPFLGSQVLGGILLRAVATDSASSGWDRIWDVIIWSLIFALATCLVIALVVYVPALRRVVH